MAVRRPVCWTAKNEVQHDSVKSDRKDFESL